MHRLPTSQDGSRGSSCAFVSRNSSFSPQKKSRAHTHNERQVLAPTAAAAYKRAPKGEGRLRAWGHAASLPPQDKHASLRPARRVPIYSDQRESEGLPAAEGQEEEHGPHASRPHMASSRLGFLNAPGEDHRPGGEGREAVTPWTPPPHLGEPTGRRGDRPTSSAPRAPLLRSFVACSFDVHIHFFFFFFSEWGSKMLTALRSESKTRAFSSSSRIQKE